jgi:protein O-GlcNAc transferase
LRLTYPQIVARDQIDMDDFGTPAAAKDELLARAMAYLQAGQREPAKTLLLEKVAADPSHAPSWHLLGTIAHQEGRLPDATRYLERAAALVPSQPTLHINLAELYRRQGQWERAVQSGREAVRLAPGMSAAHNNLGLALQASGQTAEAIAWFQRAIQHDPSRAKVWRNLARAYDALGEVAQALTAHRKVCELAPNDAEALRDAGRLLERLERFAEAADIYRQLVNIEQSSAAHLQLGNALRADGRRNEALHAYQQALSITPESAEILANLAQTAAEICSWNQRQTYNERLLKQVANSLAKDLPGPLSASAALVFGVPADQHLAIARQTSAKIFASVADQRRQFNFAHQRGSRERLRIGYLSADFRNHPTSHLMQGVFGKHDRGAFEIIAYSIGPDDGSTYRQRIARDCDQFIDAACWQNGQLAQRIYADRIDILVDLMGHTSRGRPEVLALRPAPIQVQYLGYAGSTGADFVDYMLVDQVTVPPELAKHYHEHLVYLPHSYQCNDDRQSISHRNFTRAEEKLPPQAFVFCCFNSSFKIEPVIFDVWMRILHAVPNSVLWLLAKWPEVEANLRREAQSRQIDPDRLVFAASRTKDEHLSRHRLADLFLDTPICNAHTTASDSLWAGVPMLTCPGETFACRVGASLLHAVGLPELVVDNLQSYEDLAIELAQNPDKLSRLKRRLSDNPSSSPLFDTSRFVRNLERAYREMWRRFETASPMGTIHIDESE